MIEAAALGVEPLRVDVKDRRHVQVEADVVVAGEVGIIGAETEVLEVQRFVTWRYKPLPVPFHSSMDSLSSHIIINWLIIFIKTNFTSSFVVFLNWLIDWFWQDAMNSSLLPNRLIQNQDDNKTTSGASKYFLPAVVRSWMVMLPSLPVTSRLPRRLLISQVRLDMVASATSYSFWLSRTLKERT